MDRDLLLSETIGASIFQAYRNRKYWKVSRAYFNFLTFILRVYFPEGLLSRGLTFLRAYLTKQRISKLNTQTSNFMDLVHIY